MATEGWVQPGGVVDWYLRILERAASETDLPGYLGAVLAECQEITGATGFSIVLFGPEGFTALACSDEVVRGLVELDVGSAAGPVHRAIESGALADTTVESNRERFSCFSALASQAGLPSVRAFPLRQNSEAVGALVGFWAGEAPLSHDQLCRLQTLTLAVQAGVSHVRAMAHWTTLAGQLEGALRSRIVIEQAKGVLAERLSLPVDEAFGVLRRSARNRGRRLDSVAGAVVAGEVTMSELQLSA